MTRILFALIVTASIFCSVSAGEPMVRPVVDATDGILLGGTIDGRWVQDAKIASAMKGSERYRLYTLAKYIGSATGGKAEEAETSGYMVDIKPLSRTQPHVIAIGGTWNALPRVPKVQSTKQQVYIDIVSDFLRQKGIQSPKSNITQILRVDLEGDGMDEVLISATIARKGYGVAQLVRANAGDYSVVLLRKVVGGHATVICLDSQIHVKPKVGTVVDKLDIPAVLDMDGDGIMEVAVGWRYYEGSGVNVYSVHGQTVKLVIGGGIGA